MEILTNQYEHTYKKPRLIYDLDYRAEQLKWAYESEENAKSFMARCKDDPAYYFNTCIMTVNPRKPKNRDRPMLLCLRQVEAVEHTHICSDNAYDSADLKSRFVGGSWMKMGFASHQWTFVEDFQALFGSRIDSLVEAKGEGNMNALFTKFDHMIKNLPGLIRMPIENAGYNYTDPYKVQMTRINPNTGATISGEAMTENFGSGARGGFALLDELSKASSPEASWLSCGQTVSSRQAVATPNGRDFFWGLCYPKQYAELYGKSYEEVEKPKVFRTHWKDIHWFNEFLVLSEPAARGRNWNNQQEFDEWYDNLLKTPYKILQTGHGYIPGEEIPIGMGYDDHGRITREDMRYGATRIHERGVCIIYPWYERERLRYDDQGAAQELDINFDKSKAGRVYSIQFVKAELLPSIKRVDDYPLYFSLDPGRSAGNAFAMSWVQWNWRDNKYEWLRGIAAENHSIEYFLPLLTGRNEDFMEAEAEHPSDEWYRLYDELWDHGGDEELWRVNYGSGDPAGVRATIAASKSNILTILRLNGIQCRADWKWHPFPERITSARKVLGYSRFDEVKVPRLIAAIRETAWPEVKQGKAAPETEGYFHHPTHSHWMAQYEYFACMNPHKRAAENRGSSKVSERVDKAVEAVEGVKILTKTGHSYDAHMRDTLNELVSGNRAGY